jgi:hypothetical protein
MMLGGANTTRWQERKLHSCIAHDIAHFISHSIARIARFKKKCIYIPVLETRDADLEMGRSYPMNEHP